jgi:S1-C subfamily serine protease
MLGVRFAAGQNMVPSNILTRVFCLRVGSDIGSSFTIEVNDRQYLITARHVLKVLGSGLKVQILQDGTKWRDIEVRPIPVEPESVDIGVLALKEQLSDTLPVELSGEKNSYLSQAVFFVGFPYALSIAGHNLNRGFPIPLVKHGIIAALSGPRGEPFLVDAINNPGFSGGPIVRTQNPNKPAIIGVVSAYKVSQERVFNKEIDTGLTTQANTGLLVAFSLDYALEAIQKDAEHRQLSSPSQSP